MSEDNVLPFIPPWLEEVIEVLREDQRTEADLEKMARRAREIPKMHPLSLPQDAPRSPRRGLRQSRSHDLRLVRASGEA